ncbi:MAG: chromosomal replication initiator protein DnaA [Phycisphaeraceae bacterium]|nr:chromosomal replication initiator protein DnaA [Phycisphaeraceae bacterium]
MTKLDSALWRDMIDHLRKRHAPICRQWFDDLEPVGLEGGLLTIHTDNAIQKNYLQRQCREQFNEAAQAATGALVAVQFVTPDAMPSQMTVREAAAPTASASTIQTSATPSQPTPAPSRTIESASPHSNAHAVFEDEQVLSPDYSFENFVTGPGNDLAYAAATAVANQLGNAYNPLFIHGGVGLGKTHLLQAICQKVLYDNPGARICYLSCETFVNQFLDCVQKGQMSTFRDRYRHVDLLVIDDIQFLTNRDRSQEEFFHTFNALYQNSKQIVLSSDRAPSEIPQLEERLVSRFGWGLVTSVAKPDYETRLAIVRAKAQVRGLEISDDVICYIATRIDSNAREMEGAITTIQGHAALQNKQIDLALARKALGEQEPVAGKTQITLQVIIDAVTRYYNVRLGDLQSKRRHKSITEPRQICMWLARKHTRFSLEEIGGYFGGRDHTTVMHSIRTVEQRMSIEAVFAQQVNAVEQMFTQGSEG